MRILLNVVLSLAMGLVLTLAVAFVLVLSDPAKPVKQGNGLDFSDYLDNAQGSKPAPDLHTVPMRDGYALSYRRFDGPEGAPMLILVHGSGWHGLQFTNLALTLSQKATVLVPDLRGHGTAPGRRGDIDYITQYEDDLVDLISAFHVPRQKIILGGHSSGGGLVLRFAGGSYGQLLDGAVLMAPFLKHDAPTTQKNSGGWATVQVRRMIGLSILNTFGIRAFNGQKVIQFSMPPSVLDGPLGQTATTAYSYRLNTGYAPHSDYLADVAALPPFLLIVGADDGAFYADRYEETMAAVTDIGHYVIVPGMGHLGIVDAPETARSVLEYLDGF